MKQAQFFNRQRRFLIVISILAFFVSQFLYSQRSSQNNLIQLAILLDTSNSMDGLIDQAKSQLWKVVNELAVAKRDGETPDLEVALYEYGKSSLPQGEGYLRMILPLSADLDQVSEELFKLNTNGGDEYCGLVIDKAVDGLQWHSSSDVLKIIYIAGNEPFTQGSTDYRRSCKKSIEKGIIVNTIFCGNYDQGIQTQWKDGADLADGQYMNIDQNRVVAHIPAPQDDEIMKLSQELNQTYLSYGVEGRSKKVRQSTQDKNALAMSPASSVQRSVAKSSKLYKNEEWDLVDAVEAEVVVLEEMKEEDLPEELKGKDQDEIQQVVQEMKTRRTEIQEKIQKLSQQRDAFVQEKRKEQAGEQTLDEAMIQSIREQAEKQDYSF